MAFCLTCVLCSAMAAGLTLGLVSLDPFALRVLCNRTADGLCPGGSEKERAAAQAKLLSDQRCAARILPLVSGRLFGDTRTCCFNPSNGHVLLVTLLLANSAANEALPVFLGRLVPDWLAIVLAVSVLLLFGEVLPSAIFTGPRQLQLAAALTPLVRAVRIVLLPAVAPISLMLDKCLGHHGADEDEERREEMKAMATTLQQKGLESDEVNMIHGVLEMHGKTVAQISKPLVKAKMVAHDDVLSHDMLRSILRWGHSRVFVYRRHQEEPARRDDIIGVLLVKKLLGVSLQEGHRVEGLVEALKQPLRLCPTDNLLSALKKFEAGTCHLAVVGQDPAPALPADAAAGPSA